MWGGSALHVAFCGNLGEMDYSEYLEVHGRIILKWILNGMEVRGLDLYVAGQGQETGCCGDGNERSD